MKIKLFFILIVIFISLINSIQANSDKGDIEITVFSGWSFLSADSRDKIIPLMYPLAIGRSIKGSQLFGFKVGYYFTSKAEIEGSFSVAPAHELEGTYDCLPNRICPMREMYFFPYWFANIPAYHYDTNFLFNFGSNKFRPFVSAGIGGVSYDVGREIKTNFAFNFSAGIKYYFKNKGVRFEINEHIILDHFLSGKNESNLQLQGGFFVLF